MAKSKTGFRLLIISLAIVIVFSFLASVFNTGMFKVDVSRISFDTANGTLSGLLYMPKGASAENPRPTVIVTHGYLNSAEMQDANAIELSRRGYVVLALDMYDHGHSNIKEEVYEPYAPYGAFLMTWAPFWVNSMTDAVNYMYDQPYVLKDEAGNGIIGVTGHSMGGFSSTMAVANDEKAFAESGIRKIKANLTEGSDFSYSGIFGVTAQAFDAAGGGRILGKVAAQYDEFFFNDPKVSGGTVRHKDYVSTPDGMTFLQLTEPGQANTWYDTSDGGKRIIYQPAQTHPWNHFSSTTTGYAIEFYNTAFADYQTGITAMESGSQVWFWKEFFECCALVGFILFLLSIVMLLQKVPFFSQATTAPLAPRQTAGGLSRLTGAVLLLIGMLLPAILFEAMYGWDKGSDTMFFIFCAAIFVALFGLAFVIKGDKKQKIGGCIALLSGAVFALLTRLDLYTAAKVWTAPVVNDIAKWTVGSTFIALSIMCLVYLFSKSKEGVTLADYGIVFKPSAIIAGLCTSVVAVAAAYCLLFLVDLVFKTDFRIWTFAFKTFDANILPAFFRYLPTFLAFYLVSTASICINTNTESLKGWKGYLVAAALNACGILVWLIRQYVTLFSTGVAAHPGASLSGIVLVAMVPTLAIAGCISRYLYKRTGNIWTAAFTNGILMTLMTIANTTVFYK